jgi:hypothetical protein
VPTVCIEKQFINNLVKKRKVLLAKGENKAEKREIPVETRGCDQVPNFLI